ncbi:MAG: hypothetical protein L0177_16115, partial [Chloroflexi bacterium]|nr:hypothetical protein [Chloroflexota bacterium]
AGWTLPFPKTRADRQASGDPRTSIEERYASKDDFLERVRQEAETLVAQGYMLAEDIEDAVERAAVRYDFFVNTNGA